jgi:hypothetical protein
VRQYPSHESNIKSNSFKKKLNQIIFGKKTVEIVKPISLFAEDTTSLWVLDQGAGTIVNFINQESKIPSFINKELKNFTSLAQYLIINCFLPIQVWIKFIVLIRMKKK